MVAGYSGTPLPKKLGIKEGCRVGVHGAPEGFDRTLGELPFGVSLVPANTVRSFDVLLLFARETKTLDKALPRMISRMAPETALWICWPKKTSSLALDLTEDGVRSAGLRGGLVDIKVCAVDEDWSGLKFVFRLKDRPTRKK